MIDIVRKDPTKPVGEAIKEVKLRLAKEHEKDKETFNSVIDALGNHHALEQRLTEARLAIIGPTPKSRKDFNINTFKEKNLISEDAIVLDSENLPENWESLLEPKDQETSYHWDKMNDAMMELDDSDEYVDEIHDKWPDDTHEANANIEDQNTAKPKRVLIYTSESLLKVFAKCKCGSLDGTFK